MNRKQRIFLALFTLLSTLVAAERTHAQGREDGCDGTMQQIDAGILGDGSATIVFTNSEGTYIRGIFTQDGEAEWVFSNPLWGMWGQDGGWPDDCPRPPEEAPKDDPTDNPTDEPKNDPTDSPDGGGTTTTTTTITITTTTTTTTTQQSTGSSELDVFGNDYTLEEELAFLVWLEQELASDADSLGRESF